MLLLLLYCIVLHLLYRKRVDGDLAVSRAFGDFQFKTSVDLPAEKQKVSCLPDIKVVPRTSADEALILACDGLWDVYSNEEACEEICYLYSVGENDMMLIAEEMLDLSLFKGSRDNISAVILKLPGAKVNTIEGESVTDRRERRASERDNIDDSHETEVESETEVDPIVAVEEEVEIEE